MSESGEGKSLQTNTAANLDQGRSKQDPHVAEPLPIARKEAAWVCSCLVGETVLF